MVAPVWTAQDYQDFYGGNVLRYDPSHPLYGQDLGIGYNRYRYSSRVEYASYSRLVQALLNRSSYAASSVTLFVGCGFGYGMAIARAFGAQASRIWGIDNSAYIHLNKTAAPIGESDPRFIDLATHILNENFLTVTTTIMKAAGVPNPGTFDWIIGENVDESIPANERAAWLATYHGSLLKAQGSVVHFVDCQDEAQTEAAPPIWVEKSLTWQPLSAWALEAPNDYWIATNRYEFVAGDPPTSQMIAIAPA